jgi:hypothetical protein
MAGIIAGAAAAPQAAAPAPTGAPAGPSSNIVDPMLNKTKMAVEAKVGQQIKQTFMQIEMAGLALVTQGQMPSLILKKIQGNPDVAGVVSDGVANVIAMIYNEVSGKMQPDQSKAFAPQFLAAAPAASVAIMCQVLDMAEQALKIQMTPDLIAKTTQATTTKVLTKLHVSQDQIQQAIAAGNQQKGA